MPEKKTVKSSEAKVEVKKAKSVNTLNNIQNDSKDVASEKITFSIDKKSFVYAIVFVVIIMVSVGFFVILSDDVDDSDYKKQNDIIVDKDGISLGTPSIDGGNNGIIVNDSKVDDTSLHGTGSISEYDVVSDFSISESEQDTSYILEAGEVVAKVGVVVETDAIDVTLESYEFSTSYIYQEEEDGKNLTDTARAGKQFLIAYFSVNNTGGSSFYVGSSKITLISNNVYTFEPIIYEGYDALPKSKRIYTGTESSGRVVFEIPVSSWSLKIRYSLSGLSISDRFVTWLLD
ncbi:MAG: DUF4352 domain-containing protein [DPANN group archaeon]|nr:DUF4352 domain-containing protein [DPANN group archaeon]